MSKSRTLGERFRFTATELNALHEQAVHHQKKQGAITTKEKIKIANYSFFPINIHYHHLTKNWPSIKNLWLFEVTKDSEKLTNFPYLLSISKVLSKALEALPANAKERTVLLFPLVQCRGYLKLPTHLQPILSKNIQKRHVVLLEVDFARKKVILHDSQRDFNFLIRKGADLLNMDLYPDKIQEIFTTLFPTGFTYEKKFYNQQHDNVTCGSFIHQYVLSYLARGDNADFSQITVKVGEMQHSEEAARNPLVYYLGNEDKSAYLRQYIAKWGEGVHSDDEVTAYNTFEEVLDEPKSGLHI